MEYHNGDKYIGNLLTFLVTEEPFILYCFLFIKGMWMNDLKHGKGKWKKKGENLQCNMYEGEYADDKKNGMGHFIWESGN